MKKVPKKKYLRADRRRRQLEERERRRLLRRFYKRLNRNRALKHRRAFALMNNVPFDSNLSRTQITMPRVFSLTSNYDESLRVIQTMRLSVEYNRNPVMLHFTTLESIEPAAALVLVAEIDRLRALRGQSVITGTYPEDPTIYELLCDMGFFSLLKVAEVGYKPRSNLDQTRPIFLRFLSDRRVPAEQVDQFVGVIEKHIVALNALARERLVAAIIEAMANTIEHAHPSPRTGEKKRDRWWMSSKVSLTENEVTIVLFDQGVGIPETLDPTAYESIRAALANISRLRLSAQPTDGEMILAATEYHRSGTGSKKRGRGFADMKRFVDVCADGELRVLSNRGSYHYIAASESYANVESSLGGTLIEWRFRNDGMVEMSDG